MLLAIQNVRDVDVAVFGGQRAFLPAVIFKLRVKLWVAFIVLGMRNIVVVDERIIIILLLSALLILGRLDLPQTG